MTDERRLLPKSIRFVTRKWAPAMGGMETYCHRLTEELSKNYEVDVMALPGRMGGAAPTAFTLIIFGLKTASTITISIEGRCCSFWRYGNLAPGANRAFAAPKHSPRDICPRYRRQLSLVGRYLGETIWSVSFARCQTSIKHEGHRQFQRDRRSDCTLRLS